MDESKTKPLIINIFSILILILFLFNLLTSIYILFSDEYTVENYWSLGFVIIISIFVIFFSFRVFSNKEPNIYLKSYLNLIALLSFVYIAGFIDSALKFNFGFNLLPLFTISIIFAIFPSFRKFNREILKENKIE